MRLIKLFTSVAIFLSAFGAQADVKYLDDIMAKATPEERNDLGKILQSIQTVPAKDPETGKSVMRVTRVEKGPVYDREGIKIGDLVSGGRSKHSGRTMELKSQFKAETNSEAKSQ